MIRRLVIRIVLAVSVIAVGALLFAWLILNRSLPQIDGNLGAASIGADIRIERDAAGIPTITARDRLDLAFATGFVHGQDRFFQMDLTRRSAAGELAALVGPAALPLDRRHRLHRFRARAREVIARAGDDDRRLVEAYARGVNAGLSGLSSNPFEYFVLRSRPERWLPEDSILVGYAMFLDLNDETASREIARGLVRHVMPEAVFDWLYPAGTRWDAPLEGDARAPAAIPGPEQLTLAAGPAAQARGGLRWADRRRLAGSNNWAVSGGLSRGGGAIVANDMHLNIMVPGVFYRARLIVTGQGARDVSGVSLPGTPLIIAGSNGRVAWGFTNSYGDWSDAVVLRPGAEEGSYLTPDGPLRFDEYREHIAVKGGPDEELVVRETIWGPVLDGVDYPEGPLAVSWTAHKAEAVNIRHVAMETAVTVAEAMAVANVSGIPPQNFVAGDTHGNIGWTIAGRIPRRAGEAARVPEDWSRSGGWTGWLDPDEYPRIVNPSSGRIWTANARVADGTALAAIGDGGYDLGARAQQIRDNLFSRSSFREDDMLRIQLDDRALFLSRWRDLLLTVIDEEAIRQHGPRGAYRELAEDWIPRASTGSVGYRLVQAFRTEVRDLVFEMLTQPVRQALGEDVELRMSNQFEAPLWALVTERPAHLLGPGFPSWRALLLDAVDRNLRHFEDNYAGPLRRRTWGELNTASIRHPLSASMPVIWRWLDMPREPLSGDWNMPKVLGPSFGASERFAVSPGREADGYLHIPAGQSGHPLSDFYRRGHDDWVDGRPSPFLPGPAQHTLILLPSS